MREFIRKVRRTLKPSNWARFPQVIQIDTNNFCGPKFCGVNCTYCYPQWKISLGKRDYTYMPASYIELILDQIYKYGRDDINLIDFFLNGDGLTEPRLPELHKYSKKLLPYAITQTFTNGVLTENYEKMMDLDRICFTISAHTPELYRIVHRGDKFNDALKTLELVLDNKKQKQKVEVHCVLTNDNVPYAKDWWGFFGENYPDATRIISPLVASYDNIPSRRAMGDYTLDELEKIVIDIAGAEGRMWTRELIPDEKPCVLWDNFSVDVEGWLLKCCNWSPPEDVNFGNVYKMEEEGYTLRDAWRARLLNRFDNPLCRSCNMKHPTEAQERMNRMKVVA